MRIKIRELIQDFVVSVGEEQALALTMDGGEDAQKAVMDWLVEREYEDGNSEARVIQILVGIPEVLENYDI